MAARSARDDSARARPEDESLTRAVDELELSTRGNAVRAHERAQELLDEVGDRGDPVLVRRLQLIQADCDSARWNDAASVQAIRAIQLWALTHDEPALQARSHRHLAVVCRRAGALDQALTHAVAAVDMLPRRASARLRADHLQILADALGMSGETSEAMRRYDQAAGLARRARAWEQLVIILNNEAYSLLEVDRVEESLAVVTELLSLLALVQVRSHWQVLDTVATAYVQAGRIAEAEQVLEPLARHHAEGGQLDDRADMISLVTLASIKRHLGRLDEAAALLADVRSDAAAVEQHELVVVLLQEEAELLAAQGRHREALDTYREFHTRTLGLRSQQQAARARALHAVLESDETRREREEFRQLALVDPLTGMANRRALGEHLLTMLQPGATPTVLALLDLDHFKRVNDRCSHMIGDAVLVKAAELVEGVARGLRGGLAARLGGEEFVVVGQLDGDPADAGALMRFGENLRTVIEAQDWTTQGCPGLRLTTSIGVSASPVDGTTQRELLTVADERVYAAKAAGRNTVVVR